MIIICNRLRGPLALEDHAESGGSTGQAQHNRSVMNKRDIVDLLVSQTKLPPAAAADELDRLVTKILKDLKAGSPVALPGLGVLERKGTTGAEFRLVNMAQKADTRRRR